MGKGDKPRNCFSKKFKENYDSIDWGKKPAPIADMRLIIRKKDTKQSQPPLEKDPEEKVPAAPLSEKPEETDEDFQKTLDKLTVI